MDNVLFVHVLQSFTDLSHEFSDSLFVESFVVIGQSLEKILPREASDWMELRSQPPIIKIALRNPLKVAHVKELITIC